MVEKIGDHLRHWRQHRRLSQQGLALEAEISTRHLSYVETGRAQPSREMVLRLAERLSVPLRERNALLVAAGFAPMYQARPLNHPDLAAARECEEEIDLAATHEALVEIEQDIQKARDTHNGFLKELGLPLLPLYSSSMLIFISHFLARRH